MCHRLQIRLVSTPFEDRNYYTNIRKAIVAGFFMQVRRVIVLWLHSLGHLSCNFLVLLAFNAHSKLAFLFPGSNGAQPSVQWVREWSGWKWCTS